MSIDSPVADDLIDVPQQVRSPLASGVSFGPLRGVSPLLFVIAILVVGAGVGTAITTGANLALSLLVGYAAFAATVAMLRGAAPAADAKTIDVTATTPGTIDAQTTTAAWKLVSTFTVSDASRLLCNVEPGAAATQESIAWGRALIDAVKAGDLAIAAKTDATPGSVERERENPHYMTEVTREALRSWADQKGAVPDFLRP
ncbi:MAG: hypothetical protein ACTHLO_01345 [Pseudolabrys sp.]